MSEEKYTTLIQQTQAHFRSDQPLFAPPLSQELRQAVRQRRQDRGLRPLLQELMSYRVPVWQAAGYAAAIFFVLLFSLGREGTQPPTVYVYLTDTIYKMIPAPVVEPNWSDTVARVLPTSALDASLDQEHPFGTNQMSIAISPNYQLAVARPDTGQMVAYDSASVSPPELYPGRHLHPPGWRLEAPTDSVQGIY